MSDFNFREPRNQEVIGVVIIFLDNLRRYFFGFLAAIGYLISQSGFKMWLILAFFVGIIVIAVLAWVQFKRFLFHVDDEALMISSGIFVQEKTRIPFDRIQTVHLHQNLIQQVLGLTGVKVDTAGSGKKELEVKALTKSDALALQEVLQRKSKVVEQTEEGAEPIVVVEQEEAKRLLVRLGILDLIKVGLTQNHIRNGFVVIGVVIGWFWQLEEYFGNLVGDPDEYVDSATEAYADLLDTNWWLLGVVIVLAFLLVSIVVSIIRVFLRYFNLNSYLSSKAIHVNAGLFKRNEYTIPLKKIQIVEWYGNVLRKLAGFESVKVFQGQSQDSGKQSVEIPACFAEQTRDIESTLYPEAKGEMYDFGAHKFYRLFIRVSWAIISLILLIVPCVILGNYWILLVWFPWNLIVWIASHKYVRSIKVSTNGEVLVYSRGWLSARRSMIKLFKVQSVEWSQSFFQRKRGTAHLTIYTAGGSRTMRFVPKQLALELHAYLLYKVETYEGSWM